MNAIPLSAPDGRVYAWACGVCRRVAGGSSYMVEVYDDEHVTDLAESSLRDATDCCSCRRCGAETGTYQRIERNHMCEACWTSGGQREEAERCARIDAAYARAEAEREESLARALDRDAALALEERMSEISEECYCAGWLHGLEFTLWRFCEGGGCKWGIGEVSDDDIAALRTLSAKAGGWWRWVDRRDGSGGARFVTWAEWDAIASAKAREVEWPW